MLERRVMKVSRRKTEFMCVNEREEWNCEVTGITCGTGPCQLFKGTASGKEVKKNVQVGWTNMLGVICDQRVATKGEGRFTRG